MTPYHHSRPPDDPKGTGAASVSEVDQAYIVNKQLKTLLEIDKTHKVNLRNAAEATGKLLPGAHVVLSGSQFKAVVSRPYDKVVVRENVDLQDVLRLKALLPEEAVSVSVRLSLRQGVTVEQVKRLIGDQFDRLFTVGQDVVIQSEVLQSLIDEAERVKNASVEPIKQFLAEKTVRQPQTPAVSFKR